MEVLPMALLIAEPGDEKKNESVMMESLDVI